MKLPTFRWPLQSLFMLALVLAGIVLWQAPIYGAETPVVLPPPALDDAKAPGPPETAVLAGGCFWGVQGAFEHVRGVQRVLAGYAGGERATAHYDMVSSGETGHAESVEITFDPAQISFGQLLQIAFSVVFDPTQLNRQAPDIGSQYRSAVIYGNESQKRIAAAYIDQLNQAHAFPRPIVTRVDPLKGFFAAEDYHQDYLIRHTDVPYIAIYDLPKLENLKRVFPAIYNGRAVLASNQGR